MRTITILAAVATLASATLLPAQGAGERTARPARPGAPGAMRGPMGRGGPMMADRALLRGITLDESQRARLQEQRKAAVETMKEQRGKERPNVDALREARAKGDTAALRRLRAAGEAQFEARRKQHLASLRSILTSEQQKVFDANVARLAVLPRHRLPLGGVQRVDRRDGQHPHEVREQLGVEHAPRIRRHHGQRFVM